jgi:hypothetical protein
MNADGRGLERCLVFDNSLKQIRVYPRESAASLFPCVLRSRLFCNAGLPRAFEGHPVYLRNEGLAFFLFP